MQIRAAIIDAVGRQWPADGHDLRRSMGNVGIQGEALIKFCVQFLGMVFVSELDGLVTVTAMPGRTARIAREVAVELVAQWSDGVIVVKDVSNRSDDPGQPQRIMRGSNGVWLWSGGVECLGFPAEVRSTEIEAASVEGVSTILKLASALGGNGNRVAAICEATSQSWRFTLASTGSDGNLTMESVGAGFPGQFDKWIRQWIGRPLEKQDKSTYGAWTGNAIRTALTRRQLVAQHIDAKVDWPEIGRWHHNYTSVRVPIRSDDGRHVALSATRIDSLTALDTIPAAQT